MQDRYVGDIGDFANNGLLRWLCGKPELPEGHPDSPEGKLRLGVVWYLHLPESNSDGKHISYLFCTEENHTKFEVCDEVLYHNLAKLVRVGNRKVASVQRGGILPNSTAYYDSLIFKQTDRDDWMKGALRETSLAEVVFVDPDNGIAPEKASLGDCSKYVYMSELQRFAEKGQSLVIYHHFGRGGSHGQQATRVAKEMEKKLAPLHISALRYGAVQPRAYFIVSQPGHQAIIERRLGSFIASPWGKLFKRVV